MLKLLEYPNLEDNDKITFKEYLTHLIDEINVCIISEIQTNNAENVFDSKYTYLPPGSESYRFQTLISPMYLFSSINKIIEGEDEIKKFLLDNKLYLPPFSGGLTNHIINNYYRIVYSMSFSTKFSFNPDFQEAQFDDIFNETMDPSLRFQNYYFISRINLTNQSTKSGNLMSYHPGTNEERSELSKLLNLKYNGEDPVLHNDKYEWITNCGGWFVQSIVLDRADCLFAGKNMDRIVNNNNLIHPMFLEEILFLMGWIGNVHFYSRCSETVFNGTQILANKESKKMIWGDPYRFPSWMKEDIWWNERKDFGLDLELSDQNISLIERFIKFRLSTSGDLVDSLVDMVFVRLNRLRKLENPLDIIVESAIIIETLIVSGKNQVTFKFQMFLAILLGETIEERDILKKIGNLIYSIRSGGVHSSKIGAKTIKKVNKIGGMDFLAKFAVILTKSVILHTLKDKKSITIFNTEQMSDVITDHMIGHNLNIEKTWFYKKWGKNNLLSIIDQYKKNIENFG